MSATREAVRHLLPGDGRRPLSAEERVVVDDVLDAAAEWRAGRLPLEAFAAIGRLPHWDSRGRRVEGAGYARFVALLMAEPSDQRRAALIAAIDALVRADTHAVVTRQGVFDRGELARSEVVVR